MINAVHAPGDLIRKAGKATIVLQAFSIIFLGLLGWVYSDISRRYTDLQGGIRENAMWSAYQLDREARRLEETLVVMLARNDTSAPALKELSLRYDILYSRMDTLEKARFEQNFAVNGEVQQQLQTIRRAVLGNTEIFDDINAHRTISLASLRALGAEFQALAVTTQDLVVHTNNILSAYRSDMRLTVEQLELKSLVLIVLLFCSVAFLIFTLTRQLRSVRAAGLSFEAMADELSTSYKAAEAGNRAKSQFMATMGHEIRTPLNAILGMVELMELKPLPEACAANLRTIRRSGEALLDIINEILDFSKIEHGKLELEFRRVDVRALAESAAEMMRGRASEGGNRIVLDMPETLASPMIESDPTRLRQVILNLISNAVKFTSNGIVTLRIREVADATKPFLRVEVQDTGIGIDEAGKEKLFQPFSQVDASISRKYGGTGLGLTICKQIIDHFGGHMGVDSVIGKGSTFWFDVPAPAAEGVAPSTAPAPVADTVALPHLRILAVEDNKVNQEVISKFLKHLGQDVDLADNGAIAVQMATRTQYDLILMDMQMPIMDGIEATTRIKQLPPPFCDVPVIAMTANASEDDRQLCAKAGMTGFQSKPVSLPQLRSLLSGFARRNGSDDAPSTPSPLAHAPQKSAFEARRQEISLALGDDVFADLLQSFFDDAATILDDLWSALQQDEPQKLEPLLHNLKGAAANVGLAEIADTAQALRKAAPTAADIETLAESITARKLELAA